MGRKQMLMELVGRGFSVTEAAALAGMVRQTAHKWLKRVREEGRETGLNEWSRARDTQRHFEGPAIDELLALRRQHMTWGAKHLLAQLAKRKPWLELPSHDTLRKRMRDAGLIRPRHRQRRNKPVFHQRRATGPNEVWTIDFKGQFRLGDGQMCYPLTIRDAFSRKVLRIVALPNTQHQAVIDTLSSAFAEFGLPERLHSDTGAPFGSTGFGRLSQVSLFVMRLGIQHTFSRPGKPQDNGGHERLHLDLKRETAMPPARSMGRQQARFDAFMKCFNQVRMHQALGMKTPDSQWRKSPRRLPKRASRTKYDPSWETRCIDITGKMIWKQVDVFIGRALRGALVGFEPLDEGIWRLHFASFPIGMVIERRNGAVVLDYLPDDSKPKANSKPLKRARPSTGAFARSARFGERLAG